MFRLPPPYLWTPLSPQRVKGCSPLTIPKRKSKPKNASRFAKRIFCASPIYGSADDFTSSLNFTPCENVTPAAKQQVGETRKKRLAQRLAFFRFDFSFGVLKGRVAPFSWIQRVEIAGAFLVLFWHAKENISLNEKAICPAHRRVKPLPSASLHKRIKQPLLRRVCIAEPLRMPLDAEAEMCVRLFQRFHDAVLAEGGDF